MKSILRNLTEGRADKYFHQIIMYFAESMESEILYSFPTTIEEQFCTSKEYDFRQDIFLSDDLLREKIKYAKSLIGKSFEINLYQFDVKELTGNKYSTLLSNGHEIITDWHMASYMTREDVIMNMKYFMTMGGLQGNIWGVFADGTSERITTELFFGKNKSKKKNYNIPHENFHELNEEYIINYASIQEIREGHYLANKIKDYGISEDELNTCVSKIENYRSELEKIREYNTSLINIIFFRKKQSIEKISVNKSFLSLAIDSIILSRLYPKDCEEAIIEHLKEGMRSYENDEMGEDELRNKYISFQKSLTKKYSGMKKIKLID